MSGVVSPRINISQTVKEIAIMLGRNRVTVQKWLRKYRTGGINLLLESKKNKGGRPIKKIAIKYIKGKKLITLKS